MGGKKKKGHRNGTSQGAGPRLKDAELAASSDQKEGETPMNDPASVPLANKADAFAPNPFPCEGKDTIQPSAPVPDREKSDGSPGKCLPVAANGDESSKDLQSRTESNPTSCRSEHARRKETVTPSERSSSVTGRPDRWAKRKARNSKVPRNVADFGGQAGAAVSEIELQPKVAAQMNPTDSSQPSASNEAKVALANLPNGEAVMQVPKRSGHWRNRQQLVSDAAPSRLRETKTSMSSASNTNRGTTSVRQDQNDTTGLKPDEDDTVQLAMDHPSYNEAAETSGRAAALQVSDIPKPDKFHPGSQGYFNTEAAIKDIKDHFAASDFAANAKDYKAELHHLSEVVRLSRRILHRIPDRNLPENLVLDKSIMDEWLTGRDWFGQMDFTSEMEIRKLSYVIQRFMGCVRESIRQSERYDKENPKGRLAHTPGYDPSEKQAAQLHDYRIELETAIANERKKQITLPDSPDAPRHLATAVDDENQGTADAAPECSLQDATKDASPLLKNAKEEATIQYEPQTLPPTADAATGRLEEQSSSIALNETAPDVHEPRPDASVGSSPRATITRELGAYARAVYPATELLRANLSLRIVAFKIAQQSHDIDGSLASLYGIQHTITQQIKNLQAALALNMDPEKAEEIKMQSHDWTEDKSTTPDEQLEKTSLTSIPDLSYLREKLDRDGPCNKVGSPFGPNYPSESQNFARRRR
ncbi:hypothetical protein BJ508DRAFT_338032 [Ascobolus immersus RN42]|uniref:Uncharacterized protein n=1 Tax=Ascobolus immersus RN42 TaxID=1160509 RepID=A0A3N4HR26_ASCIM|nr:hypothetical protein BJ508DRAFT_338032 [Ascobolus immersus RN42]